jgi:hypothetical protein
MRRTSRRSPLGSACRTSNFAALCTAAASAAHVALDVPVPPPATNLLLCARFRATQSPAQTASSACLAATAPVALSFANPDSDSTVSFRYSVELTGTSERWTRSRQVQRLGVGGDAAGGPRRRRAPDREWRLPRDAGGVSEPGRDQRSLIASAPRSTAMGSARPTSDDTQDYSSQSRRRPSASLGGRLG